MHQHSGTYTNLESMDGICNGSNQLKFVLQTFRDGMDFYFTDKNLAVRFESFLSSHVPTKTKYARKLVSADHKSNVGKFKHNFIVEIVPLCKVSVYLLRRHCSFI